MVSRQLALDLAVRPALGRADFFVASANRFALALVDGWPDWPGGRLALSGPAGRARRTSPMSGPRGPGARLLSAEALPGLDLATIPDGAAVAVEDADRLAELGLFTAEAEEKLFHLCNRLLSGGSLLVSGREPPGRWVIRLPDLASRLAATTVARLEAPDDDLLGAVLVKLFADRQLAVTPDLVQFLLTRMERSLAAAEDLVTALDRAGLATRRPVTARLAAELLRRDEG